MVFKKEAADKTQMSKEFTKAALAYTSYNKFADELARKLLSIVEQKDPSLLKNRENSPTYPYPSKEHPLEKVGASLSIFRSYVTEEPYHNNLLVAETQCNKLAAIHRQAQAKAQEFLTELIGFKNKEFRRYTEEINNLERLRDDMDKIKNELMQCHTTVDVEKNADLYRNAVTDFEAQAAKVFSLMDELPTIKKRHWAEINKYFEFLEKFCHDMAFEGNPMK
ncbi:unnamed protein product [Bursaphelenchus okinawaensis]|uniref:BAR domain-containing protein n=1 Tax=Bursaphelenchus okinawaensis TaxID=465554 RepID=A0A811LH14_9BILA|nr:unnamed protein product [Bursaphelenchus okinawaensis]CAG9123287.1 unnamed protein product [Bursaphelenchus okinawaensis]